MALLVNKITWLDNKEKKEVSSMAEFICIFYVVWWLQGYIRVKAPMNDLKAINQMRMYRKFKKVVAEACLDSWKRHTWYLTEELVILCLADASCPYRDDVAAALLRQEVLDVINPRKPKLPQLPEAIWPDNGSLPSLAKFVGPRSYLIFNLLGFSPAEMDWLKFSCDDWEKFSGYQKFVKFVSRVAVVNDAGERGVKGVQEVVGKTSKESVRQDMLLTNAEERRLHPNRGKGQETKAMLAKL